MKVKKKIFVIVLCSLLAISSIFAEENWFDGLKLKNYEIKGTKNVDMTLIGDALTPYLDQDFSRDLYSKIETDLYKIEGIKLVSANAVENQTPYGVKLVITVTEYPNIREIKYVGNNKVKGYDLTNSLETVKVNKFIDPTKKAQLDNAVAEVKKAYSTKGFVEDVPVTVDYTIDEKTNSLTLIFNIEEGEQTRVMAFNFSGNNNAASSVLKKCLTSKAKTLFNNGFLDMSKVNEDSAALIAYYQTIGYVDAKIADIKIDEVEDKSSTKYRAVNVTFVIDEGECWSYGGLTVSGNTIYSTEYIDSLLSYAPGSVLNLELLQNDITVISDLYYDNGYISNQISVDENRDENTNLIAYTLNMNEGPQAYIEDIVINGLTKTKEYVMTRELTIHEGDVFSKANLITSAQNLYNTGLLTNLDYDIQYGSTENDVVLAFNVEEGNQMDIQFGATFGGTVDGFPISGFLQWSDHNLGGRGQDFSINTNVSPDSQTLSLSFGDNWVKNHRWSNNIAFSFSHTKYKDELQKNPNSGFDNGRNSHSVYPKGVTQAEWMNNIYPDSKYLMDYDLLSAALTYQSGYTFMFDSGRLSLSGGLSFSLNKALYSDSYTPFNYLINEYGEGNKWQWKPSNKFIVSATWDGRDYIYAPTRGYVLSASATYAGGILGGLSNYIKFSETNDVYFKVASFGEEDNKKNLILSLSSDFNFMLPQFYKSKTEGKWAWYPAYLGATQNEMLYTDGMTMARGFAANTDKVFLWDNMVELGYPLVENVLQAEIFTSGTALASDFSQLKTGLDWYLAAGAGIRLKISGFPLGLYVVKNATFNKNVGFQWDNNGNFGPGLKLVLAISTSII